MDTRDQTFNIDNNRFVITYALNKDPYKVGQFCDSEFFLNRTDPRQYYYVRNPKRFEGYIRNKFMKFNPREVGPHLGFLIGEIHQNHFQYGRNLQSIIVHYFGSYTHYKDFCRELYSNKSEGYTDIFYEKCAIALLEL